MVITEFVARAVAYVIVALLVIAWSIGYWMGGKYVLRKLEETK